MGAYTPPVTNDRVFYLTFDDGPTGWTPLLIDLLGIWKGKATFFWTWSKYKERIVSSILSQLWEGGHNVGLHGLTHLSGWRIRRPAEEIIRARGLWRKVGVPLIPAFRAPYGHWRLSSLPEGIKLIFWDLMPADYLYGTIWLPWLLKNLRPGDVVVLHEHTHNKTLWPEFFRSVVVEGWRMEALPLPGLGQESYLDELLLTARME